MLLSEILDVMCTDFKCGEEESTDIGSVQGLSRYPDGICNGCEKKKKVILTGLPAEESHSVWKLN